MKKYVYEASKKQLEKPTEPNYMFCSTTKVTVYAETEDAAQAMAEAKLHELHDGTGVVLSEARFVRCDELPADWNYGYGDERKSGSAADRSELSAKNVIR